MTMTKGQKIKAAEARMSFRRTVLLYLVATLATFTFIHNIKQSLEISNLQRQIADLQELEILNDARYIQRHEFTTAIGTMNEIDVSQSVQIQAIQETIKPQDPQVQQDRLIPTKESI